MPPICPRRIAAAHASATTRCTIICTRRAGGFVRAGPADGPFREETAADYQFTRQAMDDYAIESLHRAQRAQTSGAFDREIVAVEGQGAARAARRWRATSSRRAATSPRSRRSSPPFSRDGTITAANASSISDGARCVGDDARQRRRAARPLAGLADRRTCAHAHAPAKFTTAPVFAMRKAMERAAGAATTSTCSRSTRRSRWLSMIAIHDLGLDPARLNVHGGHARSAIRSARAARASSRRCCRRSRPTASAVASPRCASAAARRRRWRSNWCDLASRAEACRERSGLAETLRAAAAPAATRAKAPPFVFVPPRESLARAVNARRLRIHATPRKTRR